MAKLRFFSTASRTRAVLPLRSQSRYKHFLVKHLNSASPPESHFGPTTYTPGTLEPGKNYYWRVDEFDGSTTHRGDIWSFTTAVDGGGVRAEYFRGMDFNNHVLTRIDPQINFNWPDGTAPDDAIGAGAYSVRWTGEIEVAFTETCILFPIEFSCFYTD